MKGVVIALILALCLAGCAAEGPDVDAATVPAPTEGMVIRGSVQTLDLSPIVTADITVLPLNITQPTAEDGSFYFQEVPLGAYTVVATAEGYASRTLSLSPGQNDSLLFTLEPLQDTPSQDTQRYKGHLQCAAEYLIIAGSCDRVSTQFGGPSAVSSEGIFEHHLPDDWATVVVDVVFDGGAASSYDGLRVTVKGTSDPDALNEYEQYGRFHDSNAFTFRIEPEQSYPDGVSSAPRNATTLLFDVFAQGHGWHQVCDPSGTFGCFLGVGAGVDVQFELVVTTFTIQAAPDGFTLQ